jgi:hypothetical protein
MIPPRHTAVLLVAGFLSPAFAQTPIGFRTDGTGRYPDAQPPLAWGPNKNVVWKIKLTQSNAIPVIVGDKLLTCTDPCVLLCVNKVDGKILWQHESFFKEVPITDQEKAVIEVERKQDDALAARQATLEKETAGLRKQVKDGSAPKEEAETRIKALQRHVEELRGQRWNLRTLYRYKEPGKGAGVYHPTGGYSSPTPVTDGRDVYVLFGNGLAACYDLDGNRRWLKLIEHPTAAFGHGASPVLVKDKLLVHFEDLVALDVRDGSEVWRRKISPSHGTAMHARVGDVDVTVHPQGLAVRVSDGVVVAKNLGSCGPNSPLVQDGKVFYTAGQARGYRLPATLDASMKWQPLWKGTSLKGGGYWFPSPVLHDGLLYAMSASPILTAVDAQTGERVYEQRLDFGGGESYPSITQAGKYLFVSSDNGTRANRRGRPRRSTIGPAAKTRRNRAHHSA